MKLKTLTLHGFKSFADKTSLDFSSNITGIVGPNGSGKSNIIDALRWATGGGRAAEFRAGEKTDLIFHGSQNKRGVGYAEVELLLSHGTRNINISRSLLRDGNTKLKLNGQHARFLDIEEELSGSGLGRGSIAIIGQGEVSSVLTADPVKLLGYVAEAAGVARLSHRRDQAQSRLDTAKDHLDRLDDLMLELKHQLEHLEHEAQEASRHSSLSREALQLRYTLSVNRKKSLNTEIEDLQLKQVRLAEAIDDGKEQLLNQQNLWHQQRKESTLLEADYRQSLMENEARRGDLRVAEERLNAVTQQLKVARQDVIETEEAIVRLGQVQAPEKPQYQAEVYNQQIAALQEDYQSSSEAVRLLEDELHSMQDSLQAKRQREAKEAQVLSIYQSQKEELTKQKLTLDQRLASLVLVDTGTLQDLAQKLNHLETQLSEAEARYQAQLSELNVMQQQQAHLSAEAQALSRATERQRAAFEARRGYAQGPKNALQSGIKGVYGSVADLIRVSENYRQAVASCLGRRAEYIVVDTSNTARKVLDHVKSLSGWVTVLPLELIESSKPSLQSDIHDMDGVIDLVVNLIETDSTYQGVINQLFGATTLIQSLPQATALAQQKRRRPRLVTLEGDLIESYGAISGGQNRANPTVLGAASDLEEAEVASREAQYKAEEHQLKVRDFQQELLRQKDLVADLKKQYSDLRKNHEQQQERYAIGESLKTELSQQLQAVTTALKELSEPKLSGTQGETELLEQQLSDIQHKLKTQRTNFQEQQLSLQELKQKQAVLIEQHKRYQSSHERFEQDQQALSRYRELVSQKQEHLEQMQQRLQEAQENHLQAEAALPSDLLKKQSAYEASIKIAQDTEALLTKLTEAQGQLATELESVNLSLARRETALEVAQVELDTFPEGLEVLQLAARAARERLSSVEAELSTLGPINHRAATDLLDVRQRHEDMSNQTQQAALAVTELEAALGRIDKDITNKLRTATAALRQHFKEHVGELFGKDAEADITVHEEEGRPVGLSIHLQPPGKRTQSLNLLSVGERTMGAMAFLFSLMEGEQQQALPFAILDEVDAPLDEANIQRFCRFVRTLGQKGTQFILITHQKATFEIAEVLWGVASDRGVSRVFSIAKEDHALVG